MSQTINKVLICIDTTTRSLKVAGRGILLARNMNAQISLLHVIDVIPGEEQQTDEKKIKAKKFISKVLDKFACAAIVYIETGPPVEKIVEKAKTLESDVIILGRRMKKRPNAVHNVTSEVSSISQIPVMAV